MQIQAAGANKRMSIVKMIESTSVAYNKRRQLFIVSANLHSVSPKNNLVHRLPLSELVTVDASVDQGCAVYVELRRSCSGSALFS